MNYIKLSVLYFYYLIIKNPLKIAFFTIALITYNYAGTFEDEKDEVEVINHFTSDNKHLYVYKKAKESEIKYDIYVSSKEQKLVNGMLIYYSYHDGNVIMWILCVISGLLFGGAFIMGRGDDDIGWSSDSCFNNALKWFVKCDKIDGKYYYHAFNRLLREDIYTHSSFRVDSFSDLRMLPTYHSKTEVRDKILKKIGI